MKPRFILFLLLFPFFIQAQNLEDLSFSEIDSIFIFHNGRGSFDEAIPYLKQGMKKAEELSGEKDTIYTALASNLAMSYMYLSKYDISIALFEEILALRKTTLGKENPKYISTLTALGQVYNEKGDWDKAEGLYNEALALYKKNSINSGEEYATLLNNIALIKDQRGQYKEAEAFYLQVEILDRKEFGEMHTNYAITLNNLAALYRRTEQYEKAEVLYNQALKIWKHNLGEEHPNYSTTLNNLAILKETLGLYEEAEVLNLKVIELDRKTLGEQHPVYARSLQNLASLYSHMGKYHEATSLYQQAKEIWEKTIGKEHPLYASLLNNMAMLYRELKEYEKAEPLYLQVVEIDKAKLGEQHPLYATALINLGAVYQAEDDYEKALKLYEQSAAIVKKALGEKSRDYAISLNRQASVYQDIHQFERAEALFLESLTIWRGVVGEIHPKYAENLISLADFYEFSNQLEKAYAYAVAGLANNNENFEEAFPNLFSTQDSTFQFNPTSFTAQLSPAQWLDVAKLNALSNKLQIRILKNLSEITNKQYKALVSAKDEASARIKLEEHYAILKAGMLLNEQVRNDFSNNQNKLRILADNSYFIKRGIDVALKLNSPAEIAASFSFAEQNKSMLLGDALKGSRARSMGDLPDSLAIQEVAFQKQKNEFKKQKVEAKSLAEKKEITAQENQLNLEYDAFLKMLKKKYPKYHALKYENIIVKAKDVQALLDSKTMLLEYFVTKEKTFLFAISADNIDVLPLEITLDSLSLEIQKLRKTLSNYKYLINNEKEAFAVFSETAFWFYNALLKPALKDRAIENLILVTDGELAHLPFEVFLTKSAAQKDNYTELSYLVNDYTISYNYSATLFAHSKQAENTQQNNHQILACASNYPPMDSSLVDLRTLELIALRKSLKPLPAAKNEVFQLSTMFEGDFLQNDSTNEAFFKENAHKYGIIHLAMHGILNPSLPILSSLAFTENKDSVEDNFLQAYEIAHLHLNANLVVLSACETGYGEFQQGEGVMSLARSFMYAGVPSLVVSLWQVNDASTAMVMASFYQYLSKGLAKDAALRAAKLDYIKKASGLAAHPAFWSPFIQLGDSRAIQIAKPGNSTWMLILGALVLGIAGFAYIMKKRKHESV